MIKNSTYSDFFPYPKFRTKQEDIIKEIEKSARLGKNILLVAPNGTGKTVMALSALLPVARDRGLKIVYVCRTHAQSTRVIKELLKIHSSIPDNSKVAGLSIRGRSEMCLNNSLLRMRVNSAEAMNICKNLRKDNNCVYYRNVRKVMREFEDLDSFLFNKPMDAEDLIEFCRENRYCPYFLSKFLLKEMSVIVCNFQWVFNPDIHFRFLQLLDEKLNKCLLVVDECHNIIDVATEVNSSKLIPSFLTLCLTSLPPYRAPEEFRIFIDFIKKILDNKLRELSSGEKVIDPNNFLRKVCKRLKLKRIENFNEFITKLKLYNAALRDQKEQDSKDVSKDDIKYLVKFWQNWYDRRNSDKHFFCYNVRRVKNRKFISLEIVALDPREITVPIFNNAYSCLCLSGTINPYVFNNLTGLNYKKAGYREIIASSPFKSRNIKALIVDSINTKSENRTPMMYKKMLHKIEEVIANTPANVGIFCASYKILNDLRMNGIYAIPKKYGKKLFAEEPHMSASKNALMLEDFKLASKPSYKGAVLLGVCGGRNCEGEDYPGDFMNAVIIAGFPYHLPTQRIQAKIKYYDKVFNNQGWVFAYFYPAIQRANQASGRPIRKENDKGAIIFLDSRFKDKLNWISDWVRKEVEIVPDRKNALSNQLHLFWRNNNGT